MSVVLVIDGTVIQTWRDVDTVQDAVDKYDLDPGTLLEGDYPPGTMHDGIVFHAPVFPPQPEEIDRFEEAIKVLMRSVSAADRVEIQNILRG